MPSVIRKLKNTYQEFGFLVATAYLSHLVLTRLGGSSGLYIYHFYEQALERPEAQRINGFTFEWLDRYSDFLIVLPRPEEKLKDRFNGSTRCLLGKKNGELASCAWFACGVFDEDEVNYRIRLGPQQVWDFDVYVIPKYRLGRLFLYTWQRASNDLRTEGYQSTLSRISAYNRTSVTTHEKLGAKCLSTAIFLKIWSFQITVATRIPYLALSIGERGKPTFDFSDSRSPL
ncbi:hypothetical protein [Lacimicrobium alkaliphilum]|uniref:N-acetyltransferase domain-containing protein n=1 Tax=Lacimicrobium alkaliphilum TaxID=1526571 RepID=A0ABQ1RMF5_9ALTE|nr:hypothetical protein [Lacimicrobium alkaliphilum]GGD75311.1 hypothetical protein GCM10011357_32900 [Lacimicrobium alkaliphilum]